MRFNLTGEGSIITYIATVLLGASFPHYFSFILIDYSANLFFFAFIGLIIFDFINLS